MAMTKKERLAKAIELINTLEVTDEITEVVTGLQHDIEVLQNRNSTPHESEKTKANKALADRIYTAMLGKGKMGLKAVKELDAELLVTEGSQKTSAILRNLRLLGKVERTYDKKVAYFEALPTEADAE